MALIALLLVSCSKDSQVEEEQLQNFPEEPLTIQQINSRITQDLETNGDLDWNTVDTHMLWSAVVNGKNVLTIGYGEEGESFTEDRNSEIKEKKEALLSLVTSNEGINIKDLKIVEQGVLNVMDVQVENIETIIALKKNPYVRYLEPNGYSSFTPQSNTGRSSSGCDKSGESINPSHYTTIAPNNAQVAWNFDEHNIKQAWNYSTGSGITIGLIDTGVSASQSLLNGNGFKDGYSSNSRYIQKFGTFIDSPWWWSNNYDGPHDKCGHGTAMASTMAAPRNDNGMPVGVAYDANLVAYRATEDVLLNDYHERKGVSNALTQLGNRTDVKIISMSIGYVWSIRNIKDAVKYAYSRGKLIFAAGGTSTSFTNGFGVIFPANMSETVAVTGVDDGADYQRCNVCHSGSKIDFTIIMEGENNTSKHPPVLNFYNNQRRYTGGSSCATATTAGIAALVWSKHPSWSRSQVLQKLKQSAEFYPSRSSNFGWGNIDALQAVQ